VRLAAALLLAALALVPSALASERHPTLNELENEVMCPVCGTTLSQSDSPAAQQIKQFVRVAIARGDTKSQIEAQLVRNYGEQILAAPPKHGFNLLAWLLPLVGISVGALLLGAAAWHWSRSRGDPAPASAAASTNGRGPVDPELERRLDDELARFDA
jgi:cytochrome c-type biogenesis protein CcmH